MFTLSEELLKNNNQLNELEKIEILGILGAIFNSLNRENDARSKFYEADILIKQVQKQ